MRFRIIVLSVVLLLSAALTASCDPVDVSDRLQLADGLFRRSLFDLAAREYQALAVNPQLIERDSVIFRLAECYRRLGKPIEAEKAYRELVELCPQSPQVPRAQLQRALILMERGGAGALEEAVKALEPLTAVGQAVEVRSAALYHKAETLEKLKRPMEALACYEALRKEFAETEYGVFSALRSAWILGQSDKKEDKRRALGIYLELTYGSKNSKVAEEACYFAAQVSLVDEKFQESADLFKLLRTKYPDSPRIKDGALAAAWAYYYCGRYQEGSEILDLIIADTAHPSREEVLYVKANCLRELSQNDAAVEFYRQQLAVAPNGRLAQKANYEMLTTLYRTGKYKETLDAIAAFTNPGDALLDNVLWMQAEAALKTDQPETVIQSCRSLVERCPGSPLVKDALYRLGWMLQKQGAWEEASAWFLKVAATYPDDPLAATSLYASGVCLTRLNQSEAALRDWTALLTKYPESALVAETLYQKAIEEVRIKQFRAAGATLDELARRFPDDPHKAEALYWRGNIYRELKDPVEAEKMFRASLAAQPSKEFERECMLELGLLLQAAGKGEEAATLFNQLLDSNVADKLGEDKLAWLAEFQHRNKHYDSAVKAAEALIKMKPDQGWAQTAWCILGRVHRDKGERDPAINAFQQAIATGATTDYGTEAALRLGELLTDSGRYEEAEKSFNDAAARAAAPEMLGMRARAYAGLARNAELKGDLDAALRYYISVGILFDHQEIVPAALSKAAELLDKQGRPEEANKMREELKQRYPNAPQAAG